MTCKFRHAPFLPLTYGLLTFTICNKRTNKMDIWILSIANSDMYISSPFHMAFHIRVEWIHVFLEIEKGPSNFRCTSQHWFHNNWRNCDPMNILSQKWPNISYRCKKCLAIFGRGYSSDNNFVNCYGISAVTYTGNCSGLFQFPKKREFTPP